MPELDLSYWEIVLTHEAGHAVAAIHEWATSADIFVRATSEDDGPPLSASFRISNILNAKMFTAPPMEIVVVCAAGKQAEKLRLNIDESKGFKTDQVKVFAALARERHLGGDVGTSVAKEIDEGYPGTLALVEQQRAALDVITTEALEAVVKLFETGNLVDKAVILSADRVQEIYDGIVG